MSLPSTLRPSPLGRSTPSGASTRRISALLSAVLSTTTDSPISGRSSATTFCIIAHCSAEAPAGVSQTIDQAPWVERTAPDGGFCSAGAALVLGLGAGCTGCAGWAGAGLSGASAAPRKAGASAAATTPAHALASQTFISAPYESGAL